MATLFDEVRSFLKQNGIALKHALGQNFLTDDNVLAAIVEAAEIRKSDTVVEIGPGIGILTRELMKRAGRVTSIEIDATLIPLLKKFTGWSPEGNLTIIEGNALTAAMPQNPYKIVANIPYHITSPLLRHVFRESVVRPSSLTLLMQREVAEKICNPSDAGLLTILVGLFGMPSIVTRVPAAAFLPPPNVESAVLHIAAFTTLRGASLCADR
jgi:16S rRNA (adenine1518-N6/adenine1519-N6)-dimethyltransferase